MINELKYKRTGIIKILVLLFFLNGKSQDVYDILSKSKKAYDTVNVSTASKVKAGNSMNPDTTTINGTLYYQSKSDQYFLLETPNWNFIRNKTHFGYNDNRKKEYETFAPKSRPPFLSGWLDNELLLPFLYDTSFFYGRFKSKENNIVSLDQNETHYIVKKHYTKSNSQEPFTIDETYFINKKTFLVDSRIQNSTSAPDGMEFKQTIMTWYKYSPIPRQVISDKIDGFISYPSKLKLKN